LREGEALPGLGYYARLTKFHEGDETFTAPRHRHEFEQIRFGVSVHRAFGPHLESDPGDVIYFPATAYDGPEIITGAEQLLVQWSRTWVTLAQQRSYGGAQEDGRVRRAGTLPDDGRGRDGARGGRLAARALVLRTALSRVVEGPSEIQHFIIARDLIGKEAAGRS
jgi:hypothetical protein